MSSGGGGRSGSAGRGSNRGRNRGGRGGSGGASVIRHGRSGKSNRPHPSSQLAASQVVAANADANTKNTNNEENEAEPDPHAVCLVCYDDTLPHQRAILPCGHDGVCGPCHLRLRYLNSDKYVIPTLPGLRCAELVFSCFDECQRKKKKTQSTTPPLKSCRIHLYCLSLRSSRIMCIYLGLTYIYVCSFLSHFSSMCICYACYFSQEMSGVQDDERSDHRRRRPTGAS